MAEKQKGDEALLRNLAQLKRRVLDVKFDLDMSTYQPIENIGIGAYGVVCSAVHVRTNDRVAIKKIPNVFDVKDVAKRTFREIKILKHFKHDNIIHIREILKPKETLADFRDVYVVFDLMESDLHKIIYSKQELSEEHVRYFLYQILRGLKYIHSAHVIHRDLKPSNLLVNEDCQLRIGDFGMARGFNSSLVEPKLFMTQYVATRWYRAPEIMLSLIEYCAAVDVWSVGCIFAEMLGRKHLFPGKDSISQIKLIVGIVGTPDNNLLEQCHSPIIKNFFQEMGRKEPVPWSKMYPKASKKAINLLGRMLVLNPKNRITVEQALVHPYLNKYHDPDDEPICVPSFNFDFENEDLNIRQLRENIHKEIMEYHEPHTPTFSFHACLRPVPKDAGLQSTAGVDNQSTNQETQLMLTHTSAVDTVPSKSCGFKDIHVNNQSQNNSIIKPDDEEIFKKPLSAKNQQKSPVHVKTENLLKVESSDVEMLSAASTDGRQQMSATVTLEPAVAKENKEPAVKDEKNKTISEDTKNLIKAALFKDKFKKRTDSVGEEDKPKITAAMRQKEREDKRKKKKEKSMEKKKKDKKKNGEEELLTSEDKELLQRWQKMQQTNIPIAPKPRSDIRGQGQMGQIHLSQGHGPIRVPVTVGIYNQQKTAGTLCHTSVVKKVSSDSAVQGQGHGFHSNERNVQQGTLNLLQQRILSNNPGQGVTTLQQKYQSGSEPQLHVCSASTLPSTSGAQQTSVLGPAPATNNFTVDFSSVPLGDISSVNFSDIDFLSLMPSPNPADDAAAKYEEFQSSVIASTASNHVNGDQNHVLYSTSQFNPNPMQTQTSSEFIDHLCSQPVPIDTRRTSETFVPLNLPPTGSPGNLSVSPNFQPSVSPTAQYLSVQSPDSSQRGSPTRHVSPNASLFSTSSDRQNTHHMERFPQGPVHQETVGESKRFSGTGVNMSDISSSGLFNQAGQSQTGPQLNSFYVNQSANERVPSETQSSQTFMFGNQSTGEDRIQSNQNFMFRKQSTAVKNTQSSQQTRESQSSSSNSNSPPPLSVDTQQAQLTFRNLFQEPVEGPSNAGNHIDATQIDLVALLSKQLSRSNVGDACPPLALTPRGTGGGFGIGVDLDSLMAASEQDGPPGTETSPLSSSILADWMEVTGNMNIDMEALEQELQSPMALSYSDLGMYSPT